MIRQRSHTIASWPGLSRPSRLLTLTGEESFPDGSIDIGVSGLGPASFYHFVGQRKQRRRHVEAQRLGGL